jgi:hypothetical protein
MNIQWIGLNPTSSMIETARGKQLVMHEETMFDELITSSPQTSVLLTVRECFTCLLLGIKMAQSMVRICDFNFVASSSQILVCPVFILKLT